MGLKEDVAAWKLQQDVANWKAAQQAQPPAQKPTPQEQKIGWDTPWAKAQQIGITAGEQALQGATFNLADDVYDPLSALVAAAYMEPSALLTGEIKDKNLANEVAGVYDMSRARRDKQWEDTPATATAATIGGALGTGILGGTTKIGASFGNMLRSGGVWSRIGKGALANTAVGAGYGYGDAQEGAGVAGGVRGGALGALFGLGIGGVGSAVGAGVKALTPKVAIPTADAVHDMARAAYKTAEQKGGILAPSFSNSFLKEAQTLSQQTPMGKSFSGATPLEKALKTLEKTIKNKPITLQAAQEIDEALSSQIDDCVELGRLNKKGRQLSQLQDMWRSHIENAPQNAIVGGREGFDALVEGRKLWSTSIRMNDIERIIERASQMEQPATGIRTGFRALLNNPSKMRGFKNSPEIVAAIKKAAQKGSLVDFTGILGSRLLSVAGLASGNPAAAAAGYAIPAAFRNAAASIQKNKADKVLRLLAEKGGVISKPKSLLSEDVLNKIEASGIPLKGILGNINGNEKVYK